MKDDVRDERWEVVDDPGRCIMICEAGPDGVILAEMVVYASKDPDHNDARQSARARLMAAAPDLLAACREALAYVERCVEPSCDEGEELPDGTVHDGTTPLGDRLRAAIAGAIGEDDR